MTKSPPGMVRVNNELTVRRMLWILPDSLLTCANEHMISDTGGTILTCESCQRQIWVMRAAHKRLYIADVSRDEADHFRDNALTNDEILRYLGAAAQF